MMPEKFGLAWVRTNVPLEVLLKAPIPTSTPFSVKTFGVTTSVTSTSLVAAVLLLVRVREVAKVDVTCKPPPLSSIPAGLEVAPRSASALILIRPALMATPPVQPVLVALVRVKTPAPVLAAGPPAFVRTPAPVITLLRIEPICVWVSIVPPLALRVMPSLILRLAAFNCKVPPLKTRPPDALPRSPTALI